MKSKVYYSDADSAKARNIVKVLQEEKRSKLSSLEASSSLIPYF